MAALALAPRERRLLLVSAAAAAAAGYGIYRLYLRHRRRVAAVLSLADALSETGSDLACFLRSDSDQVPRSLLQLSKLASSDHVSGAASALSESVASGVLRALSSHQAARGPPPCPPLHDRILDRLFSPAGTGFASAVLGSFARNLVLSFHDPEPKPRSRGDPEWLAALCSDRGKEAAAELVRTFVGTAVAAYLDRTAAARTSGQFLDGITNPKHEAKLKDLAVSICNGAVETFVRMSRRASMEASVSTIEPAMVQEVRNSAPSRVMETISSTLAMPSNRRFVLDVTARVTAETVRSFLEFSAQRVSDGARKSIAAARDEFCESGFVAVKYLSTKSMAIFTICLALCMHISIGTRFVLPS